MVLLLFQMNSCNLEVIPPTNPDVGTQNVRSSFQFAVPAEPCASNCQVTFTNTSQNATTFEWNFGDGTSLSTLPNPTHNYSGPGSYAVTLRAIRDTVEHDTTLTVVINAPVNLLKAFTHTANDGNTSAQLTALDNVLTNNISTKIVVVTPVLGLKNTAALGVYYFSNKWRIFTQNVTNIQSGEIFNVVVSDPDANAFVHQVSAGGMRTGYISTIDHPATNNKPAARLFITPIWEKSGDYNNHPVGVVYTNNRWEIVNLDKVNLPVGLKFNVIVSIDNTKSFTHTSSPSTVIVDYTTFDDVKTNGKSGVKIITTSNQGTSDAVFSNPEITGLWYSATVGKWTIFNESGVDMPIAATYNILAID
jgi:PKD repeat protein